MKRRYLVIFFTLFITIISAVYAFTATPIYEVKALVEIGNYSKTPVSNLSTVIPEMDNFVLSILDEDTSADIVVKKLKESDTLFEIKVTDTSNDLASSYIVKAIQYMQSKHKIILDNVYNDRNNQISILDKQIKRKQNIFKKVSMSELAPVNFLYFMSVNEQLANMIIKKNNLKTLLLPYNYKNTHIVNSILTKDKPVKPKKKLIVIVSFITGFILSIFLVFMLEFIGRIKEKENE
jgi:capsular polysaccharide biosynthesis protein